MGREDKDPRARPNDYASPVVGSILVLEPGGHIYQLTTSKSHMGQLATYFQPELNHILGKPLF